MVNEMLTESMEIHGDPWMMEKNSKNLLFTKKKDLIECNDAPEASAVAWSIP